MREKIFTPIMIGNVEVSNRIVRLAAGIGLSNDDQTVSERELDYFEQLAKSGTGLIVFGALRIDNDWACYLPNEAAIYDDKFLPGLTAIADRIHQYGSKVFFQLWHPGLIEYFMEEGKRFIDINDMTHDDIQDIISKYQAAAVRARKAGADGVEVQLCHNYLCGQFLSPASNRRTDEYSAEPVENAMRLPMQIFEAIKAACGDDFPIIAKVNGSDFIEGGITIERTIECVPFLERAGIALITVSGGGVVLTGMSADGRHEEGWKVPFAEKVKQVTSIPVCATGSIRHPDFVEKILTEKKCDMVGMARGVIAEPEWVCKVKEDREDEMRYCISCMHCLDSYNSDDAICTVNPLIGLVKSETQLAENGNGRLVCVVGAGPGGMEAAITLAKRNFKVIVFERYGKIGGSVNLACRPNGKSKMSWLTDSQELRAEKLRIEIRLNHPVTADELAEMKPYAVIVATGSDSASPRIEGLDQSYVLDVRSVLKTRPYLSGKKIVVIGAGMTGLETATTYAEEGNTVTVIDMMPMPAPETMMTHDVLQFDYAADANVSIMMSHKLLKVASNVVVTENLETGESENFEADVVINAMGVRSNRAIIAALKDRGIQVITIGDAVAPGRAVSAVSGGYYAARDLR